MKYFIKEKYTNKINMEFNSFTEMYNYCNSNEYKLFLITNNKYKFYLTTK